MMVNEFRTNIYKSVISKFELNSEKFSKIAYEIAMSQTNFPRNEMRQITNQQNFDVHLLSNALAP